MNAWGRAAKAANHMHYSVCFVLLLLVVVGLIAGPLVGDLVTRQIEAGCAAGEIDAGLCWAAEVGGLVTPQAEANR